MEEKNLIVAARIANSIIQDRIAAMGQLGKMYNNNRDVYDALGWPEQNALTFAKLWPRYKRQGIGKRVVRLYPVESWKRNPTINDRGDPKERSAFEEAFDALAQKLRLWYFLRKVDILAGINQYGVLYLGAAEEAIDDGTRTLMEPLVAGEIVFLRAFHDDAATFNDEFTDRTSEFFGKPSRYQIRFNADGTSDRGSRIVHPSRVIHVADNTDTSEIVGSSRMEPVFNNLLALELIEGASGEGYWRSAINNFNLKADPEYDMDTKAKEAIATEVEAMLHGFSQYARTQGVEMETIAPAIVDPASFRNVQINSITTTLEVPQRVFEGSERGELASSQDSKEWAARMSARRLDFNEPVILRPFIDRVIEIGQLPEPEGGEYSVDWPPLREADPTVETQNAKATTEAIVAYADSLNAENIIPPAVFFKNVLKLPQDAVDQIIDAMEGLGKDD